MYEEIGEVAKEIFMFSHSGLCGVTLPTGLEGRLLPPKKKVSSA